MSQLPEFKTIVIISANIEWQVLCGLFPDAKFQASPYGQWFSADLDIHERKEPVLFFQGGWGKISAAASTQYVIDRWSPQLLMNLGTCGGFEGRIEKGTIILVERTIVYDIIEQMLDFDESIAHYTTEIDLSWLGEPYPHEVYRTFLLSGDRDLVAKDIPDLKAKYGAVAGDWESGAIAWVADRNKTRCLILRGVTDLVGSSGGEAYEGNIQIFVENTSKVLKQLVQDLPAWIARAL
ncbi:MAG: 5'-methylthioadenosine/S-adenosylhomocysteine nucleosidase [Candidatus Tectomicrobia bacterium]|nr:5'-methylthioadenosine/S-adenosylhomocysteine nucleosidase [Candidatus Tectomicrobia bacterium]